LLFQRINISQAGIDEEVSIICTLQHDELVKLEKKHFQEKTPLAGKNYEERIELFENYHRQEMKSEILDGSSLASSFQMHSHSDRVKNELMSCQNRILRGNEDYMFPWKSLEFTIINSITNIDGDENKMSFLIAYFENLCRVPRRYKTNRGKAISDLDGWRIGRHPFGHSFSKIMVSLR